MLISIATRYREAATTLMHDTALDALHDLLLERAWPAVTMAAVATATGVSRQSLYNEFGSRSGLATAYAIRLTNALVAVVEAALDEHPNDAYGALAHGYSAFFHLSTADPLVVSLRQKSAPEDLLRLITVDSGILIEPAARRLSQTIQQGWVNAPADDAGIISRAIVRLALTYIPTPPPDSAAAAADLARLLSPFINSIGT